MIDTLLVLGIFVSFILFVIFFIAVLEKQRKESEAKYQAEIKRIGEDGSKRLRDDTIVYYRQSLRGAKLNEKAIDLQSDALRQFVEEELRKIEGVEGVLYCQSSWQTPGKAKTFLYVSWPGLSTDNPQQFALKTSLVSSWNVLRQAESVAETGNESILTVLETGEMKDMSLKTFSQDLAFQQDASFSGVFKFI